MKMTEMNHSMGTLGRIAVLCALCIGCGQGQKPTDASKAPSSQVRGVTFDTCMNRELSSVDSSCSALAECGSARPPADLTGTWRCSNTWGFNVTRVSPHGLVTIDWQSHNGSEFGHFQGCMDSTGLVPGKQVLLSASLVSGGTITRPPYENSTKLLVKPNGSVVALSNMSIEVPCDLATDQ